MPRCAAAGELDRPPRTLKRAATPHHVPRTSCAVQMGDDHTDWLSNAPFPQSATQRVRKLRRDTTARLATRGHPTPPRLWTL